MIQLPFIAWAGLGTLMLLSVPSLHAEFQLDAVTLGVGGGTAGGGTFQLAGTLGQPVVGTASGGSFGLADGVWSVLTVVPNAAGPELRIESDATGVYLTWPGGDPGWLLQFNSSLDPSTWINAGIASTPDGAPNRVPLGVPQGIRFYRLSR